MVVYTLLINASCLKKSNANTFVRARAYGLYHLVSRISPYVTRLPQVLLQVGAWRNIVLALQLYRATHHVVQNLQLTSKQRFRFGLDITFVLKLTGGFGQCDVSPCKLSQVCIETIMIFLHKLNGRNPSIVKKTSTSHLYLHTRWV